MEKLVAKTDWNIKEMPKRTKNFTLQNDLTETEMEKLRKGHIPQEMEDKWFSYFEDGKLYIHRSWSGLCVFIVEFYEDKMSVTVNRDPKQFKSDDLEQDKNLVYGLMHGVLLC